MCITMKQLPTPTFTRMYSMPVESVNNTKRTLSTDYTAGPLKPEEQTAQPTSCLHNRPWTFRLYRLPGPREPVSTLYGVMQKILNARRKEMLVWWKITFHIYACESRSCGFMFVKHKTKGRLSGWIQSWNNNLHYIIKVQYSRCFWKTASMESWWEGK